MNDLKELYYSITNPLEDKSVWDTITTIYSTSYSIEEFIANVSNISKKSTDIEIDLEDKKSFYLYIFNNWKKYLISLSDAKVNMLIVNDIFDIDFKEMLFLLKNNEVNTFEELQKLLENKVVSKYFIRILNYDKKESITISSYYDKVYSRLDYALSINIDAKHIYKIAKFFIEECEKESIPYYIKITELNNVDNTFNVYIDNIRINRYISILNRVRKENASFVGKFTYPILMGKVKEFIGLSSANLDSKDSYNKIRSKIIFNSLDAVLTNYVSNNLDKEVSYKDSKITLRAFVCMFIADSEIERLIKEKDKDINYYARNYIEINELKDYIEKQVSLSIDKVITKDLRDYSLEDTIKIPMNNNKYITILLPSFVFAIRKLLPVLMFLDKSLMEDLKTRITNECHYYSVDPVKFCFDVETATLIGKTNEPKNEQKLEKSLKLSSLINETTKLREKKDLTAEEKNKMSNNIKQIVELIGKKDKTKKDNKKKLD